MTVTATEGSDDIISFLNTGTSSSHAYLADLITAHAYLSIPPLDNLAKQHYLKEELLFYLGAYNHIATTHTALSIMKQELPSSINNNLHNSLEHTIRWNAYAYKSHAKIASQVAEKLGAACLLLRLDATAHHQAPQTRDILVYQEDIVSTTPFTLKDKDYFDKAILNRTIKPVLVSSNQTQRSSRSSLSGTSIHLPYHAMHPNSKIVHPRGIPSYRSAFQPPLPHPRASTFRGIPSRYIRGGHQHSRGQRKHFMPIQGFRYPASREPRNNGDNRNKSRRSGFNLKQQRSQ